MHHEATASEEGTTEPNPCLKIKTDTKRIILQVPEDTDHEQDADNEYLDEEDIERFLKVPLTGANGSSAKQSALSKEDANGTP